MFVIDGVAEVGPVDDGGGGGSLRPQESLRLAKHFRGFGACLTVQEMVRYILLKIIRM
jgi:hypothetical protein